MTHRGEEETVIERSRITRFDTLFGDWAAIHT